MKKWGVVSWLNKPNRTKFVSLCCPACGEEAAFEMGDHPGGELIAAVGLSLIFDPPDFKPPDHSLPDEVRCRSCRRVFGEGVENVR